MRRAPWPVVVIAILVGGTAVLSSLAYWEYRRLVDYCKGLAPAAPFAKTLLRVFTRGTGSLSTWSCCSWSFFEVAVLIGAVVVGVCWRNRGRRNRELRGQVLH